MGICVRNRQALISIEMSRKYFLPMDLCRQEWYLVLLKSLALIYKSSYV